MVLRYITTDQRIDFAWPCRVAADTDDLLALFIAAGSKCMADPKQTAAQKLAGERKLHPTHETVWRHDTLRLMFPGASHSVWLFWDGVETSRRLLRYFVNLEEPFRRTAIGFDTQDHTLDIVVTPELECRWRDEEEFERHVALGIARREHACLRGWAQWSPEPEWSPPAMPETWTTMPATLSSTVSRR